MPPTSKARLVITALFVDHQKPAEVAARYGVHRAWVYKLKARYEAEGETAMEPRSRRPKTSPGALAPAVIDLIVRIRKELADAGLDAGPETIAWHLQHHHGHKVSRSTISRQLTAAGLVTPEPKKRPKSSYTRFAASMPNETWQSDFTHYRLTRPDGRPGTDVEIISWLDDCTRYALHVSAHQQITTPIVVTTFREALARHGVPASTLTDNGMVYTVRLAGHRSRGGKNSFEAELTRRHIVQKNSRPGHPTTCGKAERFQQTMTVDPERPSPSTPGPGGVGEGAGDAGDHGSGRFRRHVVWGLVGIFFGTTSDVVACVASGVARVGAADGRTRRPLALPAHRARGVAAAWRPRQDSNLRHTV